MELTASSLQIQILLTSDVQNITKYRYAANKTRKNCPRLRIEVRLTALPRLRALDSAAATGLSSQLICHIKETYSIRPSTNAHTTRRSKCSIM